MTKASDIAADMNKVLGDGTIMMGSDPSLIVRYLPTGVMPVDVLLKGGLPRGRCTEIFGDYSTLKSYIALRAIATTQEAGGVCGLVDTEHTYDPQWLEQLGGDPDALLLKQPEFGEEAIEVSEVLLRGGVDLLVWDSVAATITKSSQEKRARDDVQPARLAAFMSRALPRLTAANKTTAMLWINQTRENVGITFGPTERTPGGRALPFFASYRMRFVKAGKISEDTKTYDGEKWVGGKRRVAQKIRCQLEKSKLNTPDREVWMTFDLRTGSIDEVGFLIAQGLETGLIQMNGAMWSWRDFPDVAPIRGAQKFRDSLSQEDIEWLEASLIGTDSPGDPPPARKRVVRRRRRSSVG